MATTTVVETVTTTEASGGLQPWEYSICSCCKNGFCDFVGKWFCGTCQYGRAMELAFNDNCLLCCLFFGLFSVGYCYTCCKRAQVRQKYQLLGSGCNDFLLCAFCPLCHIQQMVHEIEFREGKTMKCCGDVEGGASGLSTVQTTVTTTTTTTEFSR